MDRHERPGELGKEPERSPRAVVPVQRPRSVAKRRQTLAKSRPKSFTLTQIQMLRVYATYHQDGRGCDRPRFEARFASAPRAAELLDIADVVLWAVQEFRDEQESRSRVNALISNPKPLSPKERP